MPANLFRLKPVCHCLPTTNNQRPTAKTCGLTLLPLRTRDLEHTYLFTIYSLNWACNHQNNQPRICVCLTYRTCSSLCLTSQKCAAAYFSTWSAKTSTVQQFLAFIAERKPIFYWNGKWTDIVKHTRIDFIYQWLQFNLPALLIRKFWLHLHTLYFYRPVSKKLIHLPTLTKTVQKYNKHNAELQRTDPGTKVKGEFSTNFYHFHRFSWENIH